MSQTPAQGAKVELSLEDYVKERDAGTGTVIKLGGKPYYSTQRYNPLSGEKGTVNIELNEADLQKQYDSFQFAADALKRMLDDITAAREVLKD